MNVLNVQIDVLVQGSRVDQDALVTVVGEGVGDDLVDVGLFGVIGPFVLGVEDGNHLSRFPIAEDEIDADAKVAVSTEVDGVLSLDLKVFPHEELEPLGNKGFKEVGHADDKWNHLVVARLKSRACMLQEEPTQGMHRLVVLIEPVVEPSQAGRRRHSTF